MKTNAILIASVLWVSAAAAAETAAAGPSTETALPDDVAAAAALAKERGLPLMLDFTADWCGYCKLMQRDVFSRDAWKDWAATGVVVATVDLSSADDGLPEPVRALAERFDVHGFPTYVLLSPSGEEIGRLGWSFGTTAESFAGRIRAAVVEADPAALAAALPPEEFEEFARLKARVAAIESGEAVEGAAEFEAKVDAWQKRLDEAKKTAPETVSALQSEAVAELSPLRRDMNAKRRALAEEYAKAVERLGELRAKLAR